MQLKHLKLEFLEQKKILLVRISRPEVRNAFNEELIAEYQKLFAAIAAEEKEFEGVRAVLLKGDGAAFCGGGDRS